MEIDLDLDIDHYNLNDILELFRLSPDFTEAELKQAKRQVLATHPDKSKLDRKVFLFFSKAYKILFYMYNFKNTSQTRKAEAYERQRQFDQDSDFHNEQDQALAAKFSKHDNFNAVFNEIFEANKLRDEELDAGYGDWLGDEANPGPDPQTETGGSIDRDKFAAVKASQRAQHQKQQQLALFTEPTSVNGGGGYDLGRERPQYYSSDVFSKLPYEDLKRAHTETVVPVTEQDARAENFRSVDELQRSRGSLAVSQEIYNQHEHILREKEKQEELGGTHRSYLLAKQMEEAQRLNRNIKSQFLFLKN